MLRRLPCFKIINFINIMCDSLKYWLWELRFFFDYYKWIIINGVRYNLGIVLIIIFKSDTKNINSLTFLC